MNAPTELRLDKAGFLAWVQGREGRYELARGVVAMMAGVSRNHATVAGNLFGLLWSRLDRDRYRVSQGDFAVEAGESVRYADVMVEPAGGDGRALSTDQAVLLAEVLSPSSVAVDFRDKADEYMSLASLRAYLVLAQDEPRAWLWAREQAGTWPRTPATVEGRDAPIALPMLGTVLPMAEVFRGIDL